MESTIRLEFYMAIFKKKDKQAKPLVQGDHTPETPEYDAMIEQQGHEPDVDEIMREYDRESRTRNWEGTPRKVIAAMLALFSLYCIYMTLFSNAMLETRLALSCASG